MLQLHYGPMDRGKVLSPKIETVLGFWGPRTRKQWSMRRCDCQRQSPVGQKWCRSCATLRNSMDQIWSNQLSQPYTFNPKVKGQIHHQFSSFINYHIEFCRIIWGQTVKSLVWFHPAHPAHPTHSAPVSQRNVIWHWEAPGSQRGMRWGIGISGRVTKRSDVKVAQVAQCSRY